MNNEQTRPMVPVFGSRTVRTIPDRRSAKQTNDMFSVSDEDRRFQFDVRVNAIKDYLAGRRADPDVTPRELVYDSSLGSDRFDRSLNIGNYGHTVYKA